MHKLKSKPNPEEKVSKRRRVFCFLRRIATALLTFTLIGCAAQRLHEEGMNLVERGQVQEGLAKLNAASKSDPGNLSYRIDLIRTREHIIDGLLMNADAQRSAGNPEQANKLYQAVLQIDKKNTRAMTGLLNLQMDKRHAASMIQAKKLVDKHDYESAHNIVKSILLEDPTFTSARKLSRIIDRQLAKNAISGPILKPEFKKPVTLEFRDANLKMVVEALSRTSGLNILLDKDVRSDLKTTIFVKTPRLKTLSISSRCKMDLTRRSCPITPS